MNIKPLYDRVLIEPLTEEERGKKTSSGIIIPDTAGEKPQEGKVVAVGEGRQTDDGKVLPMKVKAGDRVLYTKYGPNEIKVGDKEYLIAKEDDILAIVD